METKAEKIVKLSNIIINKAERIKELEKNIKAAKELLGSQSFWCELAKQECVGLKSIVHLVEKTLKG